MNLPKTTFKFILHFIYQQWLKFFILIFAFVVMAVSDTLFPYFLKRIINTVATYHGDPSGIYRAAAEPILLLILFWFGAEFFMRLQGILQIYTFPRFRASIRAAVFDYVKAHSHEYFANHFAGSIAKKLSDLPTSCQSIIEIIGFQFVTAATGIILVTIMMWLTNPWFALILIAWLAIHLIITILFLQHGNALWETHSNAVSVLNGKIVDTFTNMLNVRLFARGDYETHYLKPFQADEIAKDQKAAWIVEIMRIGLSVNGLLLISGMLFTLLYGWAHQWVTIGDFTQVAMQSFWILGWVWHVSFQLTIFARESGTVSNGLSLVRKGHDLVDKKTAHPINIHQGEIRFENVTFAYQKNRLVFDNLNVTIPAGQKVGLVGFSGSGKSTFVNLILRFHDLQSGHILIDGQDITDVTQNSLRAQVAMIPQEPALFHRTLMENIRYGRLDASEETILHASRLAHCHEFIEKLDEGYQSLVGERGIKLSGGQRQRIAIARAMVKNAPILILDEATSSLDSVTEKLIQDSLHHLMRNKTTIVIAHRLSTLTDMDRILVFHKGQIIEEGTKESLLQKNGHFTKLWNMQTDGFLPEDE
ncbi:MAG: ABC transporter ATP-binding protein [Gammaproteobacteria bacterium]|nr:MAG: ABC transporter ATP-binding protein [Gammaproteobacteria bacterium]